MFNNIYQGKKILLTGHTGFKGAWLTKWLLSLGAEIVGVSNKIPTNPSMFEILILENKIKHLIIDIRNFNDLNKVISKEKPNFVFHLAAQAIVSTSYNDPLETISSNVMGTTNLLEALRISNHQCTAIIITSDKAYDNVEQIWGYKENDKMGGKDIYSGSKGAAELVIKSYYNSFFKFDHSNIRLAVARAGNVIGGGDWAKDRIVADAILAWNKEEKVEIRSPNATRPWQHVLEPLSGYLNLGMKLHESKILNGECFNFGPITGEDKTVKKLLTDLSKYWDFSKNNEAISINENKNFHEATLLKLNCEKSLALLNWHSSLDYKDTIKFICEWYSGYYKKNADMNEITNNQILNYQSIAKSKFLKWTA
jgi:CDP-glucose 4,6-dehydratase